MNKRKLALLIIIILFASISILAMMRYILIRTENRASQNLEESLQDLITIPQPTAEPTSAPAPATTPAPSPEVSAAPSPSPSPTPIPDDTNWPEVDFEELLDINVDVAGWIHIENTNISYPVLQGKDNQEYLNTLITGEENRVGSIFIDYRNEKDFSDRNTVIYGHHLAVGTMFSELFKFKEEEFFLENDSVLIMTPEENIKVKIFAVCVEDLNSGAWDVFFDNDAEFLSWVNNRRKGALYTRDIKITAEDRVVTLSTCSYEFDEARLIVVGVVE